MTFIYALLCPATGAVRYIGKANNPSERLRAHIRDAAACKTNHRASRWIRALLESGSKPVLHVLHEVADGDSWQEAEKRAIAEHRATGCDLTNSTSGGNGLKLIHDEDKAALSASLSAAWNRPGAKAARRNAILKAVARPDVQENRRRAINDPATKEKWRASMKASLYDNPEAMARRRASQTLASNDPVVKAKKAEASRQRWADPEYRARLQEKQKAAWIKRRQRETA